MKNAHEVGAWCRLEITIKEFEPVAKTDEGKKKVFVHPYSYKTKTGKTVNVGAHYRSTPN